jgi:hypothetical protein
MSDVEFEKYFHHNAYVFVRSDLKGRHRSFCMCYSCEKFKLDSDRASNCPIANALYHLDVLCDITTPVWECKNFVPEYPNKIKSESTPPPKMHYPRR